MADKLDILFPNNSTLNEVAKDTTMQTIATKLDNIASATKTNIVITNQGAIDATPDLTAKSLTADTITGTGTLIVLKVKTDHIYSNEPITPKDAGWLFTDGKNYKDLLLSNDINFMPSGLESPSLDTQPNVSEYLSNIKLPFARFTVSNGKLNIVLSLTFKVIKEFNTGYRYFFKTKDVILPSEVANRIYDAFGKTTSQSSTGVVIAQTPFTWCSILNSGQPRVNPDDGYPDGTLVLVNSEVTNAVILGAFIHNKVPAIPDTSKSINYRGEININL